MCPIQILLILIVNEDHFTWAFKWFDKLISEMWCEMVSSAMSTKERALGLFLCLYFWMDWFFLDWKKVDWNHIIKKFYGGMHIWKGTLFFLGHIGGKVKRNDSAAASLQVTFRQTNGVVVYHKSVPQNHTYPLIKTLKLINPNKNP